VYFCRIGGEVILLLCGGDKSTQRQGHPVGQTDGCSAEGQDTVKTTTFDVAEHLESSEDIASFLTDAFETGDAGYISHALGLVARAKGMTAIAKDAGLSRESLYKALHSEGHPKMETILKVMQALGMTISVKVDESAMA
jgi:probable addiction module antidote protein